MAYHPTPSLSFGEPLPSYPCTQTGSAPIAVDTIRAGGSAHVPTRQVAEQVMLALGMTQDWIDNRVHFALTGALLPWPSGQSPMS